MIAKLSPLKGINIGNVATVAIRELSGLTTFDLRVQPKTASQSAITNALGMALPAKPGKVLGHVLCLAPDWWLLVGMQDAAQQLASIRLMDDHHFSIVEVSGQRTTIELEGPHAREVLAHLWEQDLREQKFLIGSVSQGLMASAPVIVWHVAQFRYRVMVRSSFALHLWEALEDAAVEWVDALPIR
jgi:sarcosine oxidase, subunit gamma